MYLIDLYANSNKTISLKERLIRKVVLTENKNSRIIQHSQTCG